MILITQNLTPQKFLHMQYLISGSLVVYWPRAVCILIIDCDFIHALRLLAN